jgi:predicted TIM-barrel fold metal-dependent hydrolase
MCAVAFQCPNIYLVPDFYMHIPNMAGADEFLKAANFFLSYRLLYASSYPVRPLGQSVRQFSDLAFSDDAIRRRCLGENAGRLLGLSTA